MSVALKAIARLVTLFFSKEDIGKILGILITIPILFGLTIVLFPLMIFSHVPAAEDEQTNFYVEATEAVNKDKSINIAFQDVIALDAVLLEQRFENSSYDRALKLAKEFVGERIETVTEEYEDTCNVSDPDAPGGFREETCTKTRTVERVVYFAKTLDEVLAIYVADGTFTQEDVEAVKRYASTSIDSADGEVGVPSDLPPVTDGMFMRPAEGAISSQFGQRWGSLHAGVDIAKKGLVPIVAAADGTVTRSAFSKSYGHVVYILHNLEGQQYETVYAHMRGRNVVNGQSVAKGTFLGYMGNTGNSYGQHLHFEVHVGRWNVSKSNAVNPLLYID